MENSKNNESLILASRSPIRKKLLQKAGITVECVPSNADEEAIKAEHPEADPERLSLILAQSKAAEVSSRRAGCLVIGADQVCCLNGTVFSKPHTLPNAKRQLRELQGKTHLLISAAALVRDGKTLWKGCETARLKMRGLSRDRIERFAEKFPAPDSCGAYRYEDGGSLLFEEVGGSFECILGLPFHKLIGELSRLNAIEVF